MGVYQPGGRGGKPRARGGAGRARLRVAGLWLAFAAIGLGLLALAGRGWLFAPGGPFGADPWPVQLGTLLALIAAVVAAAAAAAWLCARRGRGPQ